MPSKVTCSLLFIYYMLYLVHIGSNQHMIDMIQHFLIPLLLYHSIPLSVIIHPHL